ncbi:MULTISPECIES: protein DpdD [unclassified Mesorhizobium]|uniref:protein DpdD n=1 Tax=unclassified Mesorhizobium TaxID=325217 RepID=UPI001129CACA|nr:MULTISPECIES: protein DpdD [unclassified Mesorhizobium]TPK52907.1 hypothetical protein FJ550_14510 [Mesorhizobium sp. B2-5-2]TPL21339.1 hypothetical protein FJ946_21420 [Mesorhizobium sp. B2-4-7]TPL42952.1 hypothetical protein FJ961_09760 [Mesorhizobium sp. B2-4-5]TPM76919.1 hypothetical protein FJ968_04185 [Mesorhizobium sp. B2-1-6]TPN80049.1 hypothetical protein FJ985_02120 [Mesorhizobium sp. B1-1-2]
MIEHLPEREQDWLARFFSAPNELSWSSLLDGSASARESDQVRQWLGLLAAARPGAPLILPFARGGRITGWFATTQGPSGGYELGDQINAWLGPTWLSSFERVAEDSNEAMAAVLRDRFGGTVYRFTGPDDAAMEAISARLSEFASVLERRPLATRTRVRPIGAIRGEFERALLAGDEAQAEATIAELKQTGRLNEENLRYLEVRLSAGLGLWPQIARDHWLIKTMADLALPPQILADLIEALYRTYVDEVEAGGEPAAIRDAFARHIAIPYPKLFASRRGIRAPRVVKAFLLFEQLQAKPDPAIIAGLLDLLPPGSHASLSAAPRAAEPALTRLAATTADEADEAFDDGQFDRAFEFYLRLPASRKTISRLVSCVGTIGTTEARQRLLTLVDEAGPDVVAGLPPGIASKIESLREAQSSGPLPTEKSADASANPWINWADQLQAGRDLASAEREVQSAPTNWDAAKLRESGQLARRFADIIGGLDGKAGEIARAAVPQIFASIFSTDAAPPPATKPIASLLFLLIAMDDALSRTDLDLLAQLAGILIEQGLSSSEYVSLISDIEDVQKRIGSYAYLPWSLDLSEALAILPCSSAAEREARLRLFLLVLGQASSFAHRLAPHDLVPIETLAKDYGVDPDAVGALKRKSEAEHGASSIPSLNGKTIGIYTLAEAAGSRAKAALEKLFPGCKVVVNSDLVATPQLENLAKTADMFVFAWKSSSHQAFYCVKDALANGEPIWAQGKGTASILRAILDHWPAAGDSAPG